MGRPQLISDSAILELAFDVISHEGFESFTFAQVGRAVKLSPAALVKRFKTKKNLALLARNHKWDQNLRKMNEAHLNELRGLSGIYGFLDLIARSVDSKRLGEHASWLGVEAGHPRSKKKVAVYFETTRKILERLLTEAIKKEELSRAIDPKAFAFTLEALIQGAIFQFAFLDEKNIGPHLRSHIANVLSPYLYKKA